MTDTTQPPAGELTFEPPGPGSWARDVDHQSTPRGRFMEDIFIDSFEAGFADCFARYGMPLEKMQGRAVNGWFYMKPKVAGAPDKGGAPPPDLVMKLITRVVPEMRKRNKAARRALEDKLWLRDAEAWERERQSWIDRATALVSTDLAALDDAGLGAHAESAIELGRDMMRRHFELIGPALAAGRLLATCDEWGIDRTEARELFRGASPASAATIEPLRELAAQVAATGSEPATFADLCAVSPEAAALAERYVAEWGWRILEDDIEAPTLADDPDQLVALVRASGAPGGGPVDVYESTRAELRSRIPAADRDRFDELVAEARAAYGSLEDNSGVLALTWGTTARSVREVGRRAAADGRLETADDIWNMGIDEVLLLAGGGSAPPADELRLRRDLRAAAAASEAPLILGDAPSPPPDASLFPKYMREVTAAFGAFLSDKFTSHEPPSAGAAGSASFAVDGEHVAVGHAIATSGASGRVVVAAEVSDALTRLEPGDILVCPYTSPAWNSIFPLLGGIVTEHGGPMGHTAVMAREFDLPAAVGVGPIDGGWDGRPGEITAT